MVLSVLGITACRLPSTWAIATALEGRPATVARRRQQYAAGAWSRHTVRQATLTG